ncbi:MAG: peptidylprolyl isomerase, partial [Oscillospiraceae bacterium]
APDPSLTIDGKKVDTKDLVICTVDGNDIDFDTFRYFYYYTLNNYAQYGITLDSIKEQEGAFDALLSDVVTTIKQEYVAPKLAKENKITLTDEDQEAIEKNFETAKSQFDSEEEYKKALKSSYMTEEFYKKMLTHAQYYDKLFGDDGKYVTSKEDFKKVVQDNDEYSRVIHILIPYECQAEITDASALDAYDSASLSEKLTSKKNAYSSLSEDEQAKAKAKAKKLAEEVLEKAKSGEYFEKLIKQYGWDSGMESNPEGYYVNKNSKLVQEFMDASFKLKENEISGLVENESYGWFIIKRLPVDLDYVDENYSTLVSEYDTPRFQELYQNTTDEMEVTYSDIYKKITIDSIT